MPMKPSTSLFISWVSGMFAYLKGKHITGSLEAPLLLFSVILPFPFNVPRLNDKIFPNFEDKVNLAVHFSLFCP